MNAVDTNILLYSIDAVDPTKQLKAQLLLLQLKQSAEQSYLLWQVLGELFHQLRRWRVQNKLSPTEYKHHSFALRNLFPVVLPKEEVLDRALAIADHYSLSHWDSMLLGACQAAGISTLYTEDMGAPRQIDGINLINPF